VVFSERPHQQGFPSVFDASRYWDPVFAAVEALGLVLCCHVGSSSHVDVPGDADYLTHNAALWLNAPHALAEYVFSGTFDRFPALKLALSEASIGWLPYGLQVMDHYYEGQRAYTGSTLQRQPSEYLGTNVFGCFIDDGVGAAAIEQLGVDAVMVEVDYPHADSIWPRVREVVDQQLAHLSPADQRKVRRDNAARLFRFEPSGVGHR
jgi:predicted TIM-barrel fold metal-dependent hydrolase